MDPLEDHDDVLRANRSREKQFVFDMVFDAKSTQVILWNRNSFTFCIFLLFSKKIKKKKQQDVYEDTTKSLLPGVLNGYNATVFAYGATGAGKT